MNISKYMFLKQARISALQIMCSITEDSQDDIPRGLNSKLFLGS